VSLRRGHQQVASATNTSSGDKAVNWQSYHNCYPMNE
jgi:hypothetical protein